MPRRNYQDKKSYKFKRFLEERRTNKVIKKLSKEWKLPWKEKKRS